jgi:hydroxymethylpyrimidine pyrophosphatase-like HAD family hydrolase
MSPDGLLRGLVYDVDGTLANHFRPPPRNLRTLLADLDEAGVVQVLASGKYHEYLGGLARGLGLTVTGWVIGENGGTIFDWTELDLEVLGEHVAEVEALRHELWAHHLTPEGFYEEPNLADPCPPTPARLWTCSPLPPRYSSPRTRSPILTR